MAHNPTNSTHTHLEPIQDRVPTAEANRLLSKFARSKFAIPEDLSEKAESLSGGIETCYRIVDTELVVREETVKSTTSQGTARSQRFRDKFVDHDINQREELIPEEFEKTEFKYLLPDSFQTQSCSWCVNGVVDCSHCDGDGRKDCSSCRGSGNRFHSENGENCRSCSGRGTKVCDNCTNGVVNCGRCGGDSVVTAYQYISRTYTPESQSEYITTLDKEILQDAEGTLITAESAPLSNSVVKHKIETYEITATRLNYTVDSKNYTLVAVEDYFQADDYPTIWWKAALPYAALLTILVVLVIIVYM